MDSLSPVCSIWVMTSESRIQKSLHAAICRYFTMSCPALLTPCRSHPPPRKPHDPVYVQKPDYGKVPGYLQLNKAKIAEERARANALLLAAEQVHTPFNTCTSLSSLHICWWSENACELQQCHVQNGDLHLLKGIGCLVCNACHGDRKGLHRIRAQIYSGKSYCCPPASALHPGQQISGALLRAPALGACTGGGVHDLARTGVLASAMPPQAKIGTDKIQSRCLPPP